MTTTQNIPIARTTESPASMGSNPLFMKAFVGPIVRENRAWFVAFLLMVVVVMQALALFQLFPLKERVPYVVEVERSTGRVAIAENVLQKFNVTQANVDYFLGQWIRWADGLNERSLSMELPTAATWTRGDAVRQLEDYINRTEVTKRLIKEPQRSQEVQVKTISYVNEGKTALVRYDVVMRSSGTEVSRVPRLLTASVALIDQVPGSEAEKVNPIGLTITNFTITNELAK
jgi:type IV secretion system protein VirB8